MGSVVGAELGTPHHRHDEDAGLVPGRGAAAGRNPGQVLQNQVQQLRLYPEYRGRHGRLRHHDRTLQQEDRETRARQGKKCGDLHQRHAALQWTQAAFRRVEELCPRKARGWSPDGASAGGVLRGAVRWVCGASPSCADMQPGQDIQLCSNLVVPTESPDVDVEVTWKVLIDNAYKDECETEFDVGNLRSQGKKPLVCIQIPARVQVPRSG